MLLNGWGGRQQPSVFPCPAFLATPYPPWTLRWGPEPLNTAFSVEEPCLSHPLRISAQLGMQKREMGGHVDSKKDRTGVGGCSWP